MPVPNPLRYLSQIAETARISGNAQGLASKILREARREHVTLGKDPRGIAAAALYLACLLRNENVTQADIAAAAHVTGVTIRNRKKELERKFTYFLKSLQYTNFDPLYLHNSDIEEDHASVTVSNMEAIPLNRAHLSPELESNTNFLEMNAK